MKIIMNFKTISMLLTATSLVAAQKRGLRTSRRMADYAGLDDTLAALKEEDSTAGYLVETYHPVFDFDTDSCLPAAAISRTAAQNGGEGTTDGGITGKCRSDNFMQLSNTYHRWDRTVVNGMTFEVHMYELYFEKDATGWNDYFDSEWEGHPHDVETVIMLFANNVPEFVAVSAHGNYHGSRTLRWNNVPKTNNHPMVVYHKEGGSTHALRFAGGGDTHAENPTGQWVLPPLASWFEMTGDGYTNDYLRNKLNTYNYGSASFKIGDAACQSEINKVRGEAEHQGTYFPFFNCGLGSSVDVNSGWFSEEGNGAGFCPQTSNIQSVLFGLECTGRYCDNNRLKCTYRDSVEVSTTHWSGSFSEEQGLRQCGHNQVVTGMSCRGSYCDNIDMECKHMTSKNLDYSNCYETASVSEEQGSVDIPQGTYPVGIRCSGRYCDNKSLRYCYATAQPLLPTTNTCSDSGRSSYPTNTWMTPNQQIFSPNGLYVLIMQTDGNLCVYPTPIGSGSVSWCTHTHGNPGAYAVMQGDGNFVLYRSNQSVLWASNTDGGNAGSTLALTDSGKVQILNGSCTLVFESH